MAKTFNAIADLLLHQQRHLSPPTIVSPTPMAPAMALPANTKVPRLFDNFQSGSSLMNQRRMEMFGVETHEEIIGSGREQNVYTGQKLQSILALQEYIVKNELHFQSLKKYKKREQKISSKFCFTLDNYKNDPMNKTNDAVLVPPVVLVYDYLIKWLQIVDMQKQTSPSV